MAKKIHPITKFRFHALIVSSVLVLAGIVGYIALGGFNLGIDFQSGYSQRVQIAPAAVSFMYEGAADVKLDVSGESVSILVKDENGSKSHVFGTTQYPTIGTLADAAVKDIEGLKANVVAPQLSTAALVRGFGFPATLSNTPVVLNSVDAGASELVTIDRMRDVLGSGVQVQVVGAPELQLFQIRLSNDEGLGQEEIAAQVSNALGSAFGADNIVVLQSDFVGPKYSSTLVAGSILIVIVSIGLILLYIWFRFKISYALAAIITLVHDTLVLLGFIVLLRLEVSTTTIAAVLTIIGYSLNNVIVIFDRVRENRPLLKDLSLSRLIDTSVSQSLTRTIFSSLTTILAILPLAILASGAIQLFAVEMVFGILVGAYSCNFLAPSLFLWISGKQVASGKSGMQNLPDSKESEVAQNPVAVSDNTTEVIPTAQRKLRGKRQDKK